MSGDMIRDSRRGINATLLRRKGSNAATSTDETSKRVVPEQRIAVMVIAQCLSYPLFNIVIGSGRPIYKMKIRREKYSSVLKDFIESLFTYPECCVTLSSVSSLLRRPDITE